MKTNIKAQALLVLLCLYFTSCGTNSNESSLVSNSPAKKKSDFYTCEELLNKSEDFLGKTVNIQAISWGSSPSFDGKEILMSLEDKKLDGMQQSHVLVHFNKDQEHEISEINENDQVKLTATVGEFESGALRLVNAKILLK